MRPICQRCGVTTTESETHCSVSKLAMDSEQWQLKKWEQTYQLCEQRIALLCELIVAFVIVPGKADA